MRLGPLYGGNEIQLQGVGFTIPDSSSMEETLEIYFGENKATNIETIDDKLISCTVPSSSKTHTINVNKDAELLNWDSTIEIFEGDKITWIWDLTKVHALDMNMRICEAESPGSVICKQNGFSAPNPDKTKIGSFTKKFNLKGIYFVTSGCMITGCAQSLTSVITVISRPDIIEVPLTVKIAGHDHSVQHNRKWTYETEHTGIVTRHSVDETGVSVMDSITIIGRNFLSKSTKVANNGWKIGLGGYPCLIEEVEKNRIICRMEMALEPPLLESLPLTVSNVYGHAGIMVSSVREEYIGLKPAVTTIISNNHGSMNGGYLLQLGGFGLNLPGVEVLFDGWNPCKIIDTSYTELSCVSPRYGNGNPEDYSDTSMVIIVKEPISGIFHNLLADNKFYFKTEETPIISLIYVEGYQHMNNNHENHHDEGYQDIVTEGSIIKWKISGLSRNGEIFLRLNDVECDLTSYNRYDNACVVSQGLEPGPIKIEFTDMNFGFAYISEKVLKMHNLTAPSKLFKVYPKKGSLYGGQNITITGTGFTDNSKVTISGKKCLISSLTVNEITCVTPEAYEEGEMLLEVHPTFDNHLFYTYSSTATPKILGVDKLMAVAGEDLTFIGENLGYTTVGSRVNLDGAECEIIHAAEFELTCTLGGRSGGLVQSIDFYISGLGIGEVDDNVKFYYILNILSISVQRVTTAGGVSVNINGNGFSKNSTLMLCGEMIPYKFISTHELIFIAPPSPNNSDRICEIHVMCGYFDGEGHHTTHATFRNLVYDSELTPVINSIEPNQGGTAGGTRITIFGSGFQSMKMAKIYISDAECVDLIVKDDTILECTTGALKSGSQQLAKIEIITESGLSTNSHREER